MPVVIDKPDNVTDGGVSGESTTVSLAGDVNGDGYGDLVIGYSAFSQVYLYLGGPTTTEWNGPSASRRILLSDPSAQTSDVDKFGGSLCAVGDLNADGYADLVIGAPGFDSNNGVAFVYLGTAGEPSPTTSILNRFGVASSLGSLLTPAGDFNGDGYADFAVADNSAHVSIYLGEQAPGSSAPEWNASDAATAAKRITLTVPASEGANTTFGSSLGFAGDVNNDGYPDLLVGSSGVPIAHLFLGSPSNLGGSEVDITDPRGTSFSDTFPWALTGVGDINGDGFGDFLISAPAFSPAINH